ncbi:hypothetical protein D7V97_30125 [Corallococcus sp. CA053C]|uniref:KilA-N domain-containing protein n=1 Tax=Corallococcus sp. CA053C TaxID=2316732 RepID=UPI000EA0A9BE|nr:KilA-N domain-containing protein [Corallococcus sp. CA053C]RKH00536.1 hypothetical protein D7V97_30125 [Corallococcus sp. CA053C]
MSSCKPSSIQVGDVVITQDAHGRYSLNDLHRAAGGEKRHQPSDFLRLASTQEMVRELNSGDPRSLPVEVVAGRNGGTYVCRDLVYDYAMWVSAEFRVKVIRVFDAVATGHVPQPAIPALPGDYLEALEALVVAEREKKRLAAENEAQQAQLAEQQPLYELGRDFLDTKDLWGLKKTARHLRVPQQTFFNALKQDKVLFREFEGGPWVPRALFREKGLLVFQARVPRRQQPGEQPKSYGQTMVTAAGVEWFSKKYGHLATPIPPPRANCWRWLRADE